MQPYHAIDDGRWAEKILLRAGQTTYAFRSGRRREAGLRWTDRRAFELMLQSMPR